jgi:hypothetical protein
MLRMGAPSPTISRAKRADFLRSSAEALDRASFYLKILQSKIFK